RGALSGFFEKRDTQAREMLHVHDVGAEFIERLGHKAAVALAAPVVFKRIRRLGRMKAIVPNVSIPGALDGRNGCGLRGIEDRDLVALGELSRQGAGVDLGPPGGGILELVDGQEDPHARYSSPTC